MNPKNWNILCWVFIALWLVPLASGFWGRSPFNTGPVPDGVVEQLADGTDVVVYKGWRIGWPFPFVEICTIDANGVTTRTIDPVIGLLNLVLVMATLAGIVTVVQTWSRQFSLRVLMVSIGGLAVLIVLTQALFSDASANLKAVILRSMYFSPLVAGVIAMILKRHDYVPRKPPTSGTKSQ